MMMVQAYEQKLRSAAKWKEETDALAKVFAEEALPVYKVEKSGFKQLLRTFDARYQLLSHSYCNSGI